MWVRSLGWEDPLEEGMTIHTSSCLENPHGQRSLVGYSSWGHKQLDTTKCACTHTAENEPECRHFFLIQLCCTLPCL